MSPALYQQAIPAVDNIEMIMVYIFTGMVYILFCGAFKDGVLGQRQPHESVWGGTA